MDVTGAVEADNDMAGVQVNLNKMMLQPQNIMNLKSFLTSIDGEDEETEEVGEGRNETEASAHLRKLDEMSRTDDDVFFPSEMDAKLSTKLGDNVIVDDVINDDVMDDDFNDYERLVPSTAERRSAEKFQRLDDKAAISGEETEPLNSEGSGRVETPCGGQVTDELSGAETEEKRDLESKTQKEFPNNEQIKKFTNNGNTQFLFNSSDSDSVDSHVGCVVEEGTTGVQMRDGRVVHVPTAQPPNPPNPDHPPEPEGLSPSPLNQRTTQPSSNYPSPPISDYQTPDSSNTDHSPPSLPKTRPSPPNSPKSDNLPPKPQNSCSPPPSPPNTKYPPSSPRHKPIRTAPSASPPSPPKDTNHPTSPPKESNQPPMSLKTTFPSTGDVQPTKGTNPSPKANPNQPPNQPPNPSSHPPPKQPFNPPPKPPPSPPKTHRPSPVPTPIPARPAPPPPTTKPKSPPKPARRPKKPSEGAGVKGKGDGGEQYQADQPISDDPTCYSIGGEGIVITMHKNSVYNEDFVVLTPDGAKGAEVKTKTGNDTGTDTGSEAGSGTKTGIISGSEVGNGTGNKTLSSGSDDSAYERVIYDDVIAPKDDKVMPPDGKETVSRHSSEILKAMSDMDGMLELYDSVDREELGIGKQHYEQGVKPYEAVHMYSEVNEAEVRDSLLGEYSEIRLFRRSVGSRKLSPLQALIEELFTTEKDYVAKLHLLDMIFFVRLMEENKKKLMLPETDISTMLSALPIIHVLHETTVLPGLHKLLQQCTPGVTPSLACVLGPLVSDLEMYRTYMSTLDRAVHLFNFHRHRNNSFSKIVSGVEKHPACGFVPLHLHLFEPLHRLTAYRGYLNKYMDLLRTSDTETVTQEMVAAREILEKITEVSEAANEAVKQAEESLAKDELERRLGAGVVKGTSGELIHEGAVRGLHPKTGQTYLQYLFMFSDVLLVTQMYKSSTGEAYKVLYKMSVSELKVAERPYGTDKKTMVLTSGERFLEVLPPSDHNDDLTTWWKVLSCAFESIPTEDTTQVVGERTPILQRFQDHSCCMQCAEPFKRTRNKHHCKGCGRVVCPSCSSHTLRMRYRKNKARRICDECYVMTCKRRTSSVDLPLTSPTFPRLQTSNSDVFTAENVTLGTETLKGSTPDLLKSHSVCDSELYAEAHKPPIHATQHCSTAQSIPPTPYKYAQSYLGSTTVESSSVKHVAYPTNTTTATNQHTPRSPKSSPSLSSPKPSATRSNSSESDGLSVCSSDSSCSGRQQGEGRQGQGQEEEEAGGAHEYLDMEETSPMYSKVIKHDACTPDVDHQMAPDETKTETSDKSESEAKVQLRPVPMKRSISKNTKIPDLPENKCETQENKPKVTPKPKVGGWMKLLRQLSTADGDDSDILRKVACESKNDDVAMAPPGVVVSSENIQQGAASSGNVKQLAACFGNIKMGVASSKNPQQGANSSGNMQQEVGSLGNLKPGKGSSGNIKQVATVRLPSGMQGEAWKGLMEEFKGRSVDDETQHESTKF